MVRVPCALEEMSHFGQAGKDNRMVNVNPSLSLKEKRSTAQPENPPPK